ncbi:MAG: hypothetical protein LC798_20645 [Chloroflexi bacterium]|nr:hypothetical protein [Chloroflexota bacterium]
MRRLLLIITAMAAILALPATTLATGPERSSAVFDFTEPSVFSTCEGFDIVATTAHIERDSLTWSDSDGNATFERRVVYFDFVLVNSVSGTEARYVGRFVRTEDLVTGEEALMGAFRQLFIDNRNVWSASGRNVFLGEDEVDISGNRSLYEWEAGLCDAMA